MDTSRRSKMSKANTTFSLALFKQLSDADKTANIFYSPFSISSALAMVMLGTAGDTHTQMSEVLCFTESPGAEQPEQPEQPEQAGAQEEQSAMQSQMKTRRQMQTQIRSRLPSCLVKCLKSENDQDEVHINFAKLLREINKADAPYALSIANRLYGEQSYPFVKAFLGDTRKYYKAGLESVDFKASAEEARVKINIWVEEKTQGKIKDLLVQGVLDDMTRLVLVNAIYFKGNWNKKFKEKFTVDAEFKINKSDTKLVKMMRQKSKFHFSPIPEVKCKILEMPYVGKELSMIILLPDDIEDDTTGLEKLEMELTYEKFMKWTEGMGNTEVNVSLPRFKMEEKYDLKEVLTRMGMKDAFDVSKSDFSGMSPANDLVLSKVIHKAYVEVNEEGTEAAAAAATDAVVKTRSLNLDKMFIADHPFLFFIRHNPTKSILFAGRYCSPE